MSLRGLGKEQREKALLLSAMFFLNVATLWLLKPVRVASLLAHLGAAETPYVRLAGVVTVGFVVLLYSRVINRLSRIQVVRWSNVLFSGLLVLIWVAIWIGGARLGAQRPFVWTVYIMVEIYSAVMIGIFWTYANDIVTSPEADRLYGIVGFGGILGGVVGGAFVDLFARVIGPINLLLVCAVIVLGSAGLGSYCEKRLHPPLRHPVATKKRGFATALEGAKEVRSSRYLMLIVAIVVAYEFTATLTDFGINVVFENSIHDEVRLTEMYGRLGWIVSGTAIVSQLFLVPALLPTKRIALLIPPFAMLGGAVGVMIVPIVGTAIFLAAADRGLNYSIQQSIKETLYVPLSDTQKYKAKAFIDMFVDRAAKALAAFVLIGVIRYVGLSPRASLLISIASMAVWLGAARALGNYWRGSALDMQPAPEPSSVPVVPPLVPISAAATEQTPAEGVKIPA